MGIPRERPGPRYTGSIPVGATKNVSNLKAFLAINSLSGLIPVYA